MALRMDASEVMAFLEQVFPQVKADFVIDALASDEIVVRMPVAEKHLRPGGTVSGPSMFGLVDVSFYMLIMARIGPEAMAVTTNCSIDFMRKPVAGVDLLCRCRLLKLGRALAVGDCLLFSEGQSDAVARASLTYSIPPQSR